MGLEAVLNRQGIDFGDRRAELTDQRRRSNQRVARWIAENRTELIVEISICRPRV